MSVVGYRFVAGANPFCSNPSDEVVEWFWKCVKSWPAERKVCAVLRVLALFANSSPTVAIAAIYHRYLANPRQRFQGSARFRWTASIHYRKGGRGDPAAKESHLFQPHRYASVSFISYPLLIQSPCRLAALQVVRSAGAKADDRRRGDSRFRTRINGLKADSCSWTLLFLSPLGIILYLLYILSASPYTSIVPCSTHVIPLSLDAPPTECLVVPASAYECWLFVSTFN